MGTGASKKAKNQPAAAPAGSRAANLPSDPKPAATTRDVSKAGVSLSFLSWFAEYVDKGSTTRSVVENVIKIQSKEKQCRYVELLEATALGAPMFYVIHCWDRPFQKMVKVLVKGLQHAYPDIPNEQIFVWLDVFAINQWSTSLGPQDLLNLQSTVTSCKAALLCLDSRGAVLTRTWVLWELWMVAATLGAARLLVLSGFVRGADLVHRFESLDMVCASFTTRPEDKALLLAAVDSAGQTDKLAATVRSALIEATRAMALSQETTAGAATERAKKAKAASDAATKAVKEAGEKDKAALQAAADDAASISQAEAEAAERASLDYALAVFRAAAILQASGMTEEAHTLYRAALDINDEDLSGESHAELECAALSALANTYKDAKQWEDAEDCCRQALEMSEKAHGAKHAKTAQARVALAVVLRRAKQLTESEALYREALASLEQAPDASPVAKASVVAGLAGVLRRSNKLADAEALLRQALAALETALGPDHNKTLAAKGQLAQVLRLSGNMDEAQTLAADLKAKQQQVSAQLDALKAAEEAAASKAKALLTQ